jgi:hypothetical protein
VVPFSAVTTTLKELGFPAYETVLVPVPLVMVAAELVVVAATVTDVVPLGTVTVPLVNTLEPFTVRLARLASAESGNGYEVFQEPPTLE